MFIFAITIESHGPWANGRLKAHLDETELLKTNPTGDAEFSLYQQHMENLISMVRSLSVDSNSQKPRVVAMYGDHMPALGPLFCKHDFTDIPTDYLLWNSEKPATKPNNLAIEDFAKIVIQDAGLVIKN